MKPKTVFWIVVAVLLLVAPDVFNKLLTAFTTGMLSAIQAR